MVDIRKDKILHCQHSYRLGLCVWLDNRGMRWGCKESLQMPTLWTFSWCAFGSKCFCIVLFPQREYVSSIGRAVIVVAPCEDALFDGSDRDPISTAASLC